MTECEELLSTGEKCAKPATGMCNKKFYCDAHGDNALHRKGMDLHWVKEP